MGPGCFYFHHTLITDKIISDRRINATAINQDLLNSVIGHLLLPAHICITVVICCLGDGALFNVFVQVDNTIYTMTHTRAHTQIHSSSQHRVSGVG